MVIELLEPLAEPVPAALVAVTVNVYEVAAVRPVTEIVPEPDCDKVPEPPAGLEVAVYEVIADPPLLAGAVNETVAVVAPVDDAEPIVGAPGIVNGVAELLAALAALVPAAFVAVTVNV